MSGALTPDSPSGAESPQGTSRTAVRFLTPSRLFSSTSGLSKARAFQAIMLMPTSQRGDGTCAGCKAMTM
jgi:hypothetical protein